MENRIEPLVASCVEEILLQHERIVELGRRSDNHAESLHSLASSVQAIDHHITETDSKLGSVHDNIAALQGQLNTAENSLSAHVSLCGDTLDKHCSQIQCVENRIEPLVASCVEEILPQHERIVELGRRSDNHAESLHSLASSVQAIDHHITETDSKLGSVHDNIAALQGQLNTAENSLSAHVSLCGDTLDKHCSQIQSVENRIEPLFASCVEEILPQHERIVELGRRSDNHAESLQSLASSVQAMDHHITETDSKLGSVHDNIAALQGQLNTAENSLSAHVSLCGDTLDKHCSQIQSVENRIEPLVASCVEEILPQHERIVELGRRSDNHAESLQSLASSVQAMDHHITETDSKLGSVHDNIAVLQGQLNTAENSLSAHVSLCGDTLDKHCSQIQSVENRIEPLVASCVEEILPQHERIVELGRRCDNHAESLQSLASSVQAMDHHITETDSKLGSVHDNIAVLQGQLNTAENSLSAHVSLCGDTLDKHCSQIQSVENRIEPLVASCVEEILPQHERIVELGRRSDNHAESLHSLASSVQAIDHHITETDSKLGSVHDNIAALQGQLNTAENSLSAHVSLCGDTLDKHCSQIQCVENRIEPLVASCVEEILPQHERIVELGRRSDNHAESLQSLASSVQAIDHHITETDSKLGSVHDNIAALQGQLNTAENSLSAHVSLCGDTLDKHCSQIQCVENRIEPLVASCVEEILPQHERIVELGRRSDNHAESLHSLASSVQAIDHHITETDSKFGSVHDNIAALQGQLNTAENSLSAHVSLCGDTLDKHCSQIQSVENRIEPLVASCVEEILPQHERIVELGRRSDNHAESLHSLASSVQSIDHHITETDSKLGSVHDDIAALQGQLNAAENSLSTHVSLCGDTLDKHCSQTQSLGNRIEPLVASCVEEILQRHERIVELGRRSDNHAESLHSLAISMDSKYCLLHEDLALQKSGSFQTVREQTLDIFCALEGSLVSYFCLALEKRDVYLDYALTMIGTCSPSIDNSAYEFPPGFDAASLILDLHSRIVNLECGAL